MYLLGREHDERAWLGGAPQGVGAPALPSRRGLVAGTWGRAARADHPDPGIPAPPRGVVGTGTDLRPSLPPVSGAFLDVSGILEPASIAVIGASERPGNLGGDTVRRLEKRGVIRSVRDVNGWRRYSPTVVDQIKALYAPGGDEGPEPKQAA